MDKQKLAILLAVIGSIGAVGGGSYALDFSNTQTTNTDNSQTSTDNSQTIIHEGDTIINEIYQEVIDEVDEFVDEVDNEFDELLDIPYDYYCEEVDPLSPECDEYWGEWE